MGSSFETSKPRPTNRAPDPSAKAAGCAGRSIEPKGVDGEGVPTRLVGECVAFGVDHPTLGQAIQVIATPPAGETALDLTALMAACRQRMPAYMVPSGIEVQAGPLPRNPNGKIDRKLLSTAWVERASQA